MIERAPVVSGTIGTYATVAMVTPAQDEDAVLGTLTWTDTAPAAGSYSYRTAGVIDGDTGAKSTAATIAATASAADVTAPTSAALTAVVTDALLQNTADIGDVMRIIYSEPITLGSTATLRVAETAGGFEETFDIVRGSNATFTTNVSPVIIGATSYAAGRILTVTLTTKPAPLSVVASGNSELRYNQTPQIQNALGIADAASNVYSPTAVVLARDITVPAITAQVGDESDLTLTLTYDRFAYFVNNSATRAQFVYKGVSPTAIAGSGSADRRAHLRSRRRCSMRMTLSTLTYTDSATTTARVVGLNGKNSAKSATTSAAVVVAA